MSDHNSGREISGSDSTSRRLYYELGYQGSISREPSTIVQDINIEFYLLLTTAGLIFVLNIPVWITLLLLLGLIISKNYLGDTFTREMEMVAFAVIFLVFLFEHIAVGAIIRPGELFAENIPLLAWIIEIVWIVLLTLQILILNQPKTSEYSQGKTVLPVTQESKSSYDNLLRRLRGGDYEVVPVSENIDSDLLRTSFIDLLKYIFAITLVIILIDTIIWDLVNNIAGGVNIQEIYIVSGMAFILYLVILFISSWITEIGEE